MRRARSNDFTSDEHLREQQDRKDQQTKIVHEHVVAGDDRDRQTQRKTEHELRPADAPACCTPPIRGQRQERNRKRDDQQRSRQTCQVQMHSGNQAAQVRHVPRINARLGAAAIQSQHKSGICHHAAPTDHRRRDQEQPESGNDKPRNSSPLTSEQQHKHKGKNQLKLKKSQA